MLLPLFMNFILIVILGISTWAVFSGCIETEMFAFSIYSQPVNYLKAIWLVAPLEILLVWNLKKLPLRQLMFALLPWVGFIPFFFFKINLFSTIAYTALTAVTVFRLLLLSDTIELFQIKMGRISENWWQSLVMILMVLFIVQQIWVYDLAWRRQFLCFEDWGIFTEVAYNTLQGEYFKTYIHNGVNFFGDHFMPGFFVWFIPILYVFPYPLTIVVIGSLCLGGSAILIYFFAKSRGLPPVWSSALAICYLLYPSISNLNLCLFYGTHVIYFFIPVFILFYMCYEREKYWLAFFIFLFSLTIKETTGPFWLGWGICQILCGRKKWGIIYAIVGTLYFLLCIKLIIPTIAGTGTVYKYDSHYAALGSGMLDIAMSPVLRPAAFWGIIFTFKNLIFILLLLLPVFLSGFNKAVLLFSGAFQLLFVIIRGNQDLINLVAHYQTENVIMLNIVMVLGCAAAYHGSFGCWIRFIAKGLDWPSNIRRIGGAVIVGTLVAAGLSHYFYAQSVYGCYSLGIILRKPDCTEIIEEVKTIIPQGIDVAAHTRSGSWLMIRNRIWPLDSNKGDFVFYDMGDQMRVHASFHARMLTDKSYGLIWFKVYKGHQFFIFQRGADSKYPWPLVKVTEQEWNTIPGKIRLPPESASFESKVQRVFVPNGKVSLNWQIRVLQKVDTQYDLEINASDGQKQFFWKIPFGYGYCLASMANPNEVFRFTLQCPAEWNTVTSVDIKIKPRTDE